MHARNKKYGLMTLVFALAMGCDSAADELRTVRSDEAEASLGVSIRGQNPEPSPISISVFADAPGNDNRHPNGEYVTLSNSGAVATEIGGWTLCEGASICFTFPSDASIPANESVRLYTGSGRNTETSFYMGHGRAVWDNDHDSATLRDGGVVVAWDIY